MKHLSIHLRMMLKNARKHVKESPEAEQAYFLSSFLSWAKYTAQDPLNLNFQKKGRKMDMMLLLSRELVKHSK